MSFFDYDKALAAVKDNPFAVEFLRANRARLEELGTELGQAALLEIVDLFAAGRNAEAWRIFYGPSTGSGQAASWAALAGGAAQDVTNTADLARRWAEVGEFLREAGVAATRALLAVVVAGFCG